VAVTQMGFEGLIYYGTAGSTATTLIGNSRDITETYETEDGDTTVRGTSGIPIGTYRVTRLNYSLEWTMLNKSSDTTLTALRAAAATGAPVAIRTLDHSGSVGFNGDMIIKVSKGKPIQGEQTFQFSGLPNDDLRAPLLNA
jgi:hypothetical protein